MKLSRWKCGTCRFEWFEQCDTSKSVLVIDHGCPQGCEDAGRIVGKVEATDNDGQWIVWRISKSPIDEAAKCVDVNPKNLTEEDYRLIIRDFQNGVFSVVDNWQLMLECAVQKVRDEVRKSGSNRLDVGKAPVPKEQRARR